MCAGSHAPLPLLAAGLSGKLYSLTPVCRLTTLRHRKPGAAAPQAALAAADPDVVIELAGPKRTATVRVFKGNVLIDVREYYEVNFCGLLRAKQSCRQPAPCHLHICADEACAVRLQKDGKMLPGKKV